MPISGGASHGNLYVEYKVILPLELSPKMHKSKSLPPLNDDEPDVDPLTRTFQDSIGLSMVTIARTRRTRRTLGMSYRHL